MNERSKNQGKDGNPQLPPQPKYTVHIVNKKTVLLTFNHAELALYWKESEQSKEVQTEFSGVTIIVEDECVKFSGEVDLNNLSCYLENQLMNVSWFTLINLRLYDQSMRRFFERSKLVESILKPQFFPRWKIVEKTMASLQQGDLVLWYKSISESLALEKRYELEGLTRCTVVIEASDIMNFEGLRGVERSVLMKVLADYCGDTIRKKIGSFIRNVEVELLRIFVRKDWMHLEVNCFRKCLLQMFEGLSGWMEQLKFQIVPFCSQKYPNRKRKLMEMLQDLMGNGQGANASALGGQYYVQDDFLVALDITRIDDRITYLLESEPRLVRVGKRELEFLQGNLDEFIKTLKRQIELIDWKFTELGLEVVSNHMNYSRAGELVHNFLARRMRVESSFRFHTEIVREIFYGYFREKLEKDRSELSFAKDQTDRQRITFMCSQDTRLSLDDELRQIDRLIRAGYTRMFVPVCYSSAIKSTCARLNSATIKVYNPLCEQGYELKSANPSMVRVIDKGQLETLRFQNVICLYDRTQSFYSSYCQKLLDKYGTLNTFRKITQKEHSKSSSFSYCNDLSCNISEVMCCFMDKIGFAFAQSLRQAIGGALEKDGVGVVVPEDEIAAERMISIFTEEVRRYSEDTTLKCKPTLKNFYLICDNERILTDTEKQLEDIAKLQLKLIPLNLTASDLFAINLANFYELTIKNSELSPTPLVGFVIGAERLCSPANASNYEGLVVNMPLGDGQLYDELFLDFDSLAVYDLTTGLEKQVRQFVKGKDPTLVKYIRAVYDILKTRQPPRLSVVYLSEGKLIENCFRVLSNQLIRTKLIGSGFKNYPEESYAYEIKKKISLDCFVLEGHRQEVLSLVMHLQ